MVKMGKKNRDHYFFPHDLKKKIRVLKLKGPKKNNKNTFNTKALEEKNIS